MRIFSYEFLETGLLPVTLLNMTNRISELKALDAQRKNQFPDIFSSLERIAKVQSVKSSNAIEGIITSDKRIQEIVNKSSAPLNHDEMEIAGYRDALNNIHEGYQTIDIKEADILNLHRILLSHTPEGGGQYKTDDNVIMAIDGLGRRSVRFEPVSAHDTAEAMEQMILAFLDARSNANINQLLLIPCFILDFLCIHPFSDGNGRISRLLSLLLLYKYGFDAVKYISYEEQINRHKPNYYDALHQSSNQWHSAQNSYIPFIENFIYMLLLCYQELDKRFAVVQDRRVTKRQRIESEVLGSLLPISKAELSQLLPDVSVTTIEVVLSDLLKQGIIEKLGQTRSARYHRKT